MKKTTLLLFSLVVISTMLIAGCTTPTATQPVVTEKPTPAVNASNVGCSVYGKDPETTNRTTFDNLRGGQYCEVWLACNDIGNLVYNTAGFNSLGNSKDSCPNALVSNFDATAMATQARVDSVYFNSPRGWTIDKVVIPVSTKVRDFQGIKSTWWTTSTSKGKLPAYQRAEVQRDSQITFNAGTPLFVMDDPTGMSCVMKSWSMIVDKTLTYNDLFNLSTRINPPAGYKYRVAIHNQSLIMTPVGGKQSLIQDELENTYDCCDPGVCTIQP